MPEIRSLSLTIKACWRNSLFLMTISLLLLAPTAYRILSPEPVFAADTNTNSKLIVYSLEDCLKIGFENSPDMKKEEQTMKIAMEDVTQAKINFWPTVSGGLDYTESFGGMSSMINSLSSIPAFAGMSFSYPSNYYSGALTLSLPVFTWDKLSNNLKVALLQLAKAGEDQRQTKLQLTFNIKLSFYDLWLKEQELRVAEASVDNLNQHYQQVFKSYQLGEKAKYDLLESEVLLRDQKAKTIAAQSDVNLAKLDLATLIEIDKDQNFEITYNSRLLQLPDKLDLTLEPLLNQAFQMRPDIHKSCYDMEIADLNVKIIKAVNRPQVSLSYQNEDIDLSQATLSDSWMFTLGLSVPLFNGATTASQVRQAEEAMDIAKINDNDIRDQIRKNVQKALETLQVDWEIALSYQANVELAQEALSMAQQRYSVGMATSLDMKDAQLSLDEASDSYYQKVAAYLTDLANIDLVLGKSEQSN